MGDLARSGLSLGLLSVAALASPFATAATFNLDLTTSTQWDSSQGTGLWNSALQQIQAGVAPAGTAGKEISFGDGSDGAFSDGPAQSGISIVGPTITFDTTTKNIFQFSSFNLSGGETIAVTGTNPLHILVNGSVTIAGTINGNGGPGQDNSVGAAPGGGTGVGSGSNGGTGGTPAGAGGTAGAPAAGVPKGGGGGANTAGSTNDQGGGGGCAGSNGVAGQDDANGTNAVNAANCGGTTYATVASGFEASFKGGAGGGGGGAFNPVPAASGGGGGGGGAAIHITAAGSITITGTVEAQGGTGGNDPLGDTTLFFDCGGGGGGGSGGSIWLQSVGNLGGAGSVNFSPGAPGGTNALDQCGGLYPGGQGSRGVYRIDRAAGVVAATPVAADQAQAISSPVGPTYTIYSKAIDFGSTTLTYQAPTETFGCGAAPANGTIAVEYDGSTDGGLSYPVNATAATISTLSNYRYLRIKVTIVPATGTPPCLTALAIPYTIIPAPTPTAPPELTDFKLKGGLACGSLGGSGPEDKTEALFEIAGLLLIAAVSCRKIRLFRV